MIRLWFFSGSDSDSIFFSGKYSPSVTEGCCHFFYFFWPKTNKIMFIYLSDLSNNLICLPVYLCVLPLLRWFPLLIENYTKKVDYVVTFLLFDLLKVVTRSRLVTNLFFICYRSIFFHVCTIYSEWPYNISIMNLPNVIFWSQQKV